MRQKNQKLSKRLICESAALRPTYMHIIILIPSNMNLCSINPGVVFTCLDTAENNVSPYLLLVYRRVCETLLVCVCVILSVSAT